MFSSWCIYYVIIYFFFFFKQKTAYEMRISDWSSDVCSSDLVDVLFNPGDVASARDTPHVLQRGHRERICADRPVAAKAAGAEGTGLAQLNDRPEIGRASCRERVCKYVSISVVAGLLKTKM